MWISPTIKENILNPDTFDGCFEAVKPSWLETLGIRGSWLPAAFKARVTDMFVFLSSSWTIRTLFSDNLFTRNTCITNLTNQEYSKGKIRSTICKMFCNEAETLLRGSLSMALGVHKKPHVPYKLQSVINNWASV